jgi:hypothetical protein
VWRTVLLLFAVVLAGTVLINVLVTTDRELVEADVERLIELARRGGDRAVDEILASLADDYRGGPPFTRERIVRGLERYVGESSLELLETGGISTIWAGDEIVIPLLRIHARTHGGYEGNLLLRIHYAERDGEWRIIEISRWDLER